MSERVFLDSNLLVYANDARDPAKQKRAAELIAQHIREGTGVVSTQVLQEYASVALTKLKQEDAAILRVLRLLETLAVVGMTPALIRRAVELRRIYGVSFWDAGILAAAEEGDCATLLSEDFNSGQYYGGLRVQNPFLG